MNLAAPVLMAMLAIPTVSSAQSFPGRRAPAGFQTKQDRREVRDDRQELVLAERLLARFNDAAARRSRRMIAAVESDVLRFLDHEIREAKLELSRSEGYGRHDRRDLRDDRRDLVRVKAIRSELSSLRGRIDRRSLERKRSLLVELVKLARSEMHEGRGARR